MVARYYGGENQCAWDDLQSEPPDDGISLSAFGYQPFNGVRENAGILDLHSLQIRTRHFLRCDLRRSLTSIPRLVKCCPIMLHDVDADRRTQVRLIVIPVDFGDQIVDRFSVLLRDVGERVPHDAFQPDGGPMITNEDSTGCGDTFRVAFISCPHGR